LNKSVNLEIQQSALSDQDLAEPLTYPVDAFISREYAEAEKEKLWPKVWQMAGRVEEIPEPGNYITYEIGDESIIVLRTAADKIKAYYNVCPHRGRRLIDVPAGSNGAVGTKARFVCGFHGWTYNLEGKNTYVHEPQDWKGCLNEEHTSLSEVKVDAWGGWLFINMDPDAVSLADYLESASSILNPFQFDKMRYKWRQCMTATGRRHSKPSWNLTMWPARIRSCLRMAIITPIARRSACMG